MSAVIVGNIIQMQLNELFIDFPIYVVPKSSINSDPKILKTIIAGSRGFHDYKLLKKKLDHYFKNKDIEIVSGTANGADKLGEKYAKERNLPLKQFPADWDTHKKAAGYIRNTEMAEYADALVLFWDGKSRGSKHMLDIAKKHNLKIRVVRYDAQ